jgi:hypothetical protein
MTDAARPSLDVRIARYRELCRRADADSAHLFAADVRDIYAGVIEDMLGGGPRAEWLRRLRSSTSTNATKRSFRSA